MNSLKIVHLSVVNSTWIYINDEIACEEKEKVENKD